MTPLLLDARTGLAFARVSLNPDGPVLVALIFMIINLSFRIKKSVWPKEDLWNLSGSVELKTSSEV